MGQCRTYEDVFTLAVCIRHGGVQECIALASECIACHQPAWISGAQPREEVGRIRRDKDGRIGMRYQITVNVLSILLRWDNCARNVGLLVCATHVHSQHGTAMQMGGPKAIDDVQNVPADAHMIRDHTVSQESHSSVPAFVVPLAPFALVGAVVVGVYGFAAHAMEAPKHFARQRVDFIPRRALAIQRHGLKVVLPHVAAMTGRMVEVLTARGVVVVPIDRAASKVDKRDQPMLAAKDELVQCIQHVRKEAGGSMIHHNAQYSLRVVPQRCMQPCRPVCDGIERATSAASRHSLRFCYPLAACTMLSSCIRVLEWRGHGDGRARSTGTRGSQLRMQNLYHPRATNQEHAFHVIAGILT